MTLDLYYKNFSSLGDVLESMYKEFLVDEFTPTMNQKQLQPTTEVPLEVKTDKVKVQESLEKLKITKAPQRKPYQPQSPHKSPRSPLPQVVSPTPSARRNPIPLRNSNNKMFPSNKPQQGQPPQQYQRDVAPKKPSPQSLRQRNSSSLQQPDHGSNSPSRKPQRTHFERSPRRNESPVPSSYQRNRRSYTPNRQPNHYQSTNGTSSNRSRVSQPNSHNSSPQEKPRSEPTTPTTQYKRHEISKCSPPIENFSWVSDGELDDLDKSASPKVQNPYTNSFLNFLAGGHWRNW